MFTPDEGGETTTHCCLEPCDPMPDGVEAIDLLALGLALDGVLAGKASVDQSLQQSVSCLANEHRTRRGKTLQTRCKIHRVAENRDARIGPFLHLPNYCRSRVEADPQLRLQAVFNFEIRSGDLEPLQNRKRRATRPQRRILKGDVRAEDCHDPVPGKTLHDAALLAHGIAHQIREAPH